MVNKFASMKKKTAKRTVAYLICDSKTAKELSSFIAFLGVNQMPVPHAKKATEGEVGAMIHPVTISRQAIDTEVMSVIDRLIIVVDDQEIENRAY